MVSEKDIKFYVTANFSNEKADENVTRNALASIAQELVRFHYGTEELPQDENDDFQLFEKNYIETAMKSKNRQLKKLKGNLKTACTVARIIMSAKDREMDYLIQHLNLIRNESTILQKNHTQNLNIIEKLRTDNFNIYNEVERVRNYIHLGYQELQKMRNEKPRELLLIMELKEILVACGQYYADYCNEHEHCVQLEQRNRFLKNKVSILENNLAATTEELRNLRNQNALVNKSRLKLSSHFSAVQNLLHDQDSMLKDLKKLSKELGAPELQ
ncbi:hypothetical protein MSG28_001586 [Choristoneura fumiferana]|uniref:Uncharacterized protein n=1 Tax=Choristoneura fumiferana TaxID=7141 RepID=A0ACC0KV70_CHOFU|nr:hypothetical protein MSG28_001586 [Choristoneura fumiferana]